MGCPIRRSRDQRSLASPPGFSQRATSFIASWRQGIHQMPLSSRLIAKRPWLAPSPQNRRKQGQAPPCGRSLDRPRVSATRAAASCSFSRESVAATPGDRHPRRHPRLPVTPSSPVKQQRPSAQAPEQTMLRLIVSPASPSLVSRFRRNGGYACRAPFASSPLGATNVAPAGHATKALGALARWWR